MSETQTRARLETAFQAFATASGQLESAYAKLESEVLALKSALAATTAQRDAAWQTVREQQLDEVMTRHQRLAVLGEMAATLAHQIRTPLSAALLYASNATNGSVPPERRNELLARAIDCLHNLEQLVGDMLGFARGATASNVPVELRDIAAAVVTAAEGLLRPGQHLHVSDTPEHAIVCGNREAMVGAILNLVSNGLHAGGAQAVVNLHFRVDGQQAELRVSDNGRGIPRAIRPRIFEPFFTTRPDGTGLGLAVVKSVAESHGGEIRLEDTEGRGACFTLRLPLAAGVEHLREARAGTEIQAA